ncbi:hypothetical protein DENIS_4762 [Desulfonema ishimotonii]|uniref:Formyl transferase N-terminal domain-containing protein n=1 Tax=Desulfonema ishimotonii TaxID=45657 RepID=A0A401G3H1_9BACT|nr:formyltransferase family protein [Desulfonema ishimotonii]GBC63764.1 hypothetical protein DENIS_4762 [Desulfonema ishimotonii]
MYFFKIIIMGFGKMPADCIEILLSKGVPIHCVLETEKSGLSPLQGLCERLAIPFERPSPDQTAAILDSIAGPAVVFSINNNYLFPPVILEKENLRIINFHNSLLPSYRGHGRAIPTWVIFNGESRHGVTWHLINATGIDDGDILVQDGFAISKTDTALTVMMRAVSLGTDLFSGHWKEFVSPQCVGRPQKAKRGRTCHRHDIPNNGWIDISWGFEKTDRFLRSTDYGPFNLPLFPRIRITGKTYWVKSYVIDKNKTTGDERILLQHASDGYLTGAEFFYPQGRIVLRLQKEVWDA